MRGRVWALWALVILLISLPSVVSAQTLDPVPAEYRTYFGKNPYWTDRVSLFDDAKEKGKVKYEQLCISCHGVNGGGEVETGIEGAIPFNIQSLTRDRETAYWYWKISEGVPGTLMPPWKDVLTEDEIWKIMVYERSFAFPDAPTQIDAETSETGGRPPFIFVFYIVIIGGIGGLVYKLFLEKKE